MKLLFFLFFPLTFFAKTYSIEINVNSRIDDQPVSGAAVVLYDEGQKVKELKSDQYGKVHFTNLNKKVYDFVVRGDSAAYKVFYGVIINKKRKNVERTISLVPNMIYYKQYCEKMVDVFLVKNAAIYPSDSSEKCKDLNFEYEAEFPGGMNKMNFFISNYLEYPEESIELGEQGRVYLSFVIEPDGNISEVTIVRGVSQLLDREAKRIIKEMPRWTPAVCNGKRMRSKIQLPISFALE
jgi:TonB family protein